MTVVVSAFSENKMSPDARNRALDKDTAGIAAGIAAEITLIHAAQQGDLEAFNRLVLTHQDLVYHHSYAMLGEAEAAEDVTQTVFLRAFRAMQRFRGGSLRAWLLKIATNACYDELRRRKRTEARLVTHEDDQGEEQDPLELLPGEGLSVEEQFEAGELNRAIQRGLSDLPVDYRAVAVLVDVLGFDYAETAASLGIPQGTVKSRLSRARQGLRRRLLLTPELLPGSVASQRL
jgi:RNA polymerase sigma-70 factor (ECF subfamily)